MTLRNIEYTQGFLKTILLFTFVNKQGILLEFEFYFAGK